MAITPAATMLLLLQTVLALTAAGAGSEDAAALLAFKAAAIGSGAAATLASWNASAAASLCAGGWEGVTCGRGGRVVALRLPSLGLSGTLSPAIGDLPRLRALDLRSNWLRGGVPSSLGRLRRLRTLDLRANTFSGALPGELASCASLTHLLLSSNRLAGRVPAVLGGALTQLQVLDLNNNSFTGPLPASLANLTSLRRLSLGINGFEGTMPPELGRDMPSLEYVDLCDNHLYGELPPSMYNLSSLWSLDVAKNALRGSIPADIHAKLPWLQYLGLFENQFTGAIPSSISNLTGLEELVLSGNGFSGFVPWDLGRLNLLWNLQLDDNRLEAGRAGGWEFIDSLANCSKLRVLGLGYNNFTGDLPVSVTNLSTTLQKLYLYDLGISGGIPSDIGNLMGLKVLYLVNTSISGVIPESIGKLENLTELHLDNNALSGLIPSSAGNLTNLIKLSASNNNLEGPIPPTLGKLNGLISLDFSWNYLDGSIPKEVFQLLSLSLILDLSHNSLSGPLPFEVGSLANLNILSLSGNQLSGQIPTTIRNCIVLEVLLLDSNSFQGSIPQPLGDIKGLRIVNLTMNKFSGVIPDALGSIHNLQQLYLAYNRLSGPIPADLQNLTALSNLDVSFNDLQGEVPKNGVFRNLSYLWIAGNKHLCGGIPQLRLDPCSKPALRKSNAIRLKSVRIYLAIAGSLLFVVLLVTIILLIRRRPKQRQKKRQPLALVTEEQYERVSYQELLDGTKGFSENNLLGKGSYGTVYRCNFIDEGTIVAVKVFNLEQSGSTRSFLAECKALRRVRHRCLIRIITCCSSIDRQGQEFKALVFEFMPNGSLDCWLHPKSNMPTVTNITLSLTQRLDIAVDIVDALDYLHNHCQPPIVHCDLKPSNILLAEDMSARVGDFGISRILCESASKTHQNSNSTMGIRGSIGYVAPEYGEGCAVSTLGDIYSLGILLLEMFTGRSPTDDMFKDALDLHKFSEDAFPDRILEIVDPALWAHSDTNDGITKSRVQECLLSAIGIALSCSKHQPKERMPIRDAAVEMHAIRDEAYLMFAGSLAVDMEGKVVAKNCE